MHVPSVGIAMLLEILLVKKKAQVWNSCHVHDLYQQKCQTRLGTKQIATSRWYSVICFSTPTEQNTPGHPMCFYPSMESTSHRPAGSWLFFASCKVWGLPEFGWGSGLCGPLRSVHQYIHRKNTGIKVFAKSCVKFSVLHCLPIQLPWENLCLHQAHWNFTGIYLQYFQVNIVPYFFLRMWLRRLRMNNHLLFLLEVWSQHAKHRHDAMLCLFFKTKGLSWTGRQSSHLRSSWLHGSGDMWRAKKAWGVNTVCARGVTTGPSF